MRPLINPARLVPGLLSGGGICILEVGITPLVLGQAYIDVVFASAQSDTSWDTQCSVVNTTDSTPLNIWPGIVTAKSTTGFTLQLNGMPDSSNYYLHWAIIPIPPAPATTYTLSGPSSGAISTASSNFTVALIGGGVASPVTVTPSSGGGGGTFTPVSVTLTTASPSATFTYTPASYGAKTISVTNSGSLIDPANLTFTSLASTYTLSGPSGGAPGAPSTNFTVALPVGGVVVGTVTVTPSSGGGGGTFTPSTVALTTVAPSVTFTYTPASVGAKTISVTNSGGLTNPGNLTYTAAVTPHLLDTLISYWKLDEASGTRNDSQGTNHLTASGAPLGVSGKISNGAQFVAASSQELTLASNASLQVSSDFTFSVWVKLAAQPVPNAVIIGKSGSVTGGEYALFITAGSGFIFFIRDIAVASDYAATGSAIANGVWSHVVAWFDSATGQVYIRLNDASTTQSTTAGVISFGSNAFFIGGYSVIGYSDSIIDEVGFWKRKLTATEITALYNGGAGLAYSSFTA